MENGAQLNIAVVFANHVVICCSFVADKGFNVRGIDVDLIRIIGIKTGMDTLWRVDLGVRPLKWPIPRILLGSSLDCTRCSKSD